MLSPTDALYQGCSLPSHWRKAPFRAGGSESAIASSPATDCSGLREAWGVASPHVGLHAPAVDAGVVHQQVEAVGAVGDGLGGEGDAVGVGHVEGEPV